MCIDLDVVPQMTDPDAVFQCAMTCLSTAGELAIVLAAGADCPIAAVFFYQVFDMGYRAHDFCLTPECVKIGKQPLCIYGPQS
jgi:hypothetical protein